MVIKDNEISLPAGVGYDVFALAWTADSIIKDNEIEGFGSDILWLHESSGNLFQDNDTEDFTSSFVDYYASPLSTSNTTYMEETETYIDEGTDNLWIIDN